MFVSFIIAIMAESPAAVVTSNSANVDHSTLSTSVQCCSEAEVPPAASELVVITYKVVEINDGQTELVIGNEIFVPLDFSDSELV